MSSALWKNSHGGDELLGTANISACRKKQKKTETYVKERLRGARRVPVVAGRGRGGDSRVEGQELRKH